MGHESAVLSPCSPVRDRVTDTAVNWYLPSLFPVAMSLCRCSHVPLFSLPRPMTVVYPFSASLLSRTIPSCLSLTNKPSSLKQSSGYRGLTSGDTRVLAKETARFSARVSPPAAMCFDVWAWGGGDGYMNYGLFLRGSSAKQVPERRNRESTPLLA